MDWSKRLFWASVLSQCGLKDVTRINKCFWFLPLFFIKEKFLEDISPFCGATDTPVLDFWWCLLWVLKPEWAASFTLGRGVCVTCSLRFTSGVMTADLLVASMAAKPFSSTYMQAGIGGAQTGICHATTTPLCETRQMFYRLNWLGDICL